MSRETRFVPVSAGLELRANGDDDPKGIRGVAILYGVTTNIGGWFEERIEPGAFDHALDSDEVVGLYNHDPSFVLARNGSTMMLGSDDSGVSYDIPELPGSRADVLEAVVRGDVRGNSFSFDIEGGEQEWVDRGKEGKIDLRIIRRGGNLYDVGPVTYPAYKQTTVAARSAVHARDASAPDLDTFLARLLEQMSCANSTEVSALQARVAKVVAENERLMGDLRRADRRFRTLQAAYDQLRARP